jgi:hypothetical protein
MSQIALSNDILDLNIQKRFRFIARLVEFSKYLLDQKGTVIKKEPILASECSGKVIELRTHKVVELKNFNSFSFLGNFEQEMLGGNDIEIWYHCFEKRDRLVFHIYYLDSLIGCQVIFDNEGDWVWAMNMAMSHGGENRTQDAAQLLENIYKDKETRDASENFRRQTLLETAEHLGL